MLKDLYKHFSTTRNNRSNTTITLKLMSSNSANMIHTLALNLMTAIIRTVVYGHILVSNGLRVMHPEVWLLRGGTSCTVHRCDTSHINPWWWRQRQSPIPSKFIPHWHITFCRHGSFKPCVPLGEVRDICSRLLHESDRMQNLDRTALWQGYPPCY
jgi:hypothetical protein